MNCPRCGGNSKIYNTTSMEFVIRNRVCLVCRARFITTETIEPQGECFSKENQRLAREYWQSRRENELRPFSDSTRELTHI